MLLPLDLKLFSRTRIGVIQTSLASGVTSELAEDDLERKELVFPTCLPSENLEEAKDDRGRGWYFWRS